MKYLTDIDHWQLLDYLKEKEKVYPLLNKKTLHFLSKDSFHDGKVLDMQIINKSSDKHKNPTDIKMRVKHWNGKLYQTKW